MRRIIARINIGMNMMSTSAFLLASEQRNHRRTYKNPIFNKCNEKLHTISFTIVCIIIMYAIFARSVLAMPSAETQRWVAVHLVLAIASRKCLEPHCTPMAYQRKSFIQNTSLHFCTVSGWTAFHAWAFQRIAWIILMAFVISDTFLTHIKATVTLSFAFFPPSHWDPFFVSHDQEVLSRNNQSQ